MAFDSYENIPRLASRYQAQLDGTANESIDELTDDLYLCAAKREGVLPALLDVLIAFLRDQRSVRLAGLEGIFSNFEIESDCFEDSDYQRFLPATFEIFPDLLPAAQFSLVHVWAKVATHETVSGIASIGPKDPDARNLLAHALGHIVNECTDVEVMSMAKRALDDIGGNPDHW